MPTITAPRAWNAAYGMQADGLYRLSDTQAQEILQMRLQRLTGLEQDKIVAEYKEVMSEIEDLLDILAKPERVATIISDELSHVKAEFGQTKIGARRSQVETLVVRPVHRRSHHPTDMVVTLSHSGYIKNQPLGEYRAQKARRARQAGHCHQGRRLDRSALHCQHARLPPVRFRTGAACTGSRSGKFRRARAVRADAPSSTCSRWTKARRSMWSCR